MSDFPWGAIATVMAAAIGATVLFLTQRHQERIKECAIRDLQRFRDLKDIWAAELQKFRPDSSAETERRRMRSLLTDKIGDFGEPRRIQKLIDRLGIKETARYEISLAIRRSDPIEDQY
jgi:hypothetical protein